MLSEGDRGDLNGIKRATYVEWKIEILTDVGKRR